MPMSFSDFGIDRGAVVAAFSGAVAYLCTQEKMPVLRAVAYVVAGGTAAMYVGPGLIEWLTSDPHAIYLGERTRYAIIFLIGVGGIWILNLVISFLQTVRDKMGGAVDRLLDRIFGKGGGE